MFISNPLQSSPCNSLLSDPPSPTPLPPFTWSQRLREASCFLFFFLHPPNPPHILQPLLHQHSLHPNIQPTSPPHGSRRAYLISTSHTHAHTGRVEELKTWSLPVMEVGGDLIGSCPAHTIPLLQKCVILPKIYILCSEFKGETLWQNIVFLCTG